MRNYLIPILSLIVFTITGCSNHDENDENQNSKLDFEIKNVYLRFNAIGGPNLEDCFYDLVITDGSYSLDASGCIANNDIQNIVYLNEIRFDNCILTNFPVEYIWLPNTPYSGMDGSNLIVDITMQNNNATNYNDLTENIVKSTLIFNSLNSFNFKIELNDGRTLQKNYSGNIINVSRDGCSFRI